MFLYIWKWQPGKMKFWLIALLFSPFQTATIVNLSFKFVQNGSLIIVWEGKYRSVFCPRLEKEFVNSTFPNNFLLKGHANFAPWNVKKVIKAGCKTCGSSHACRSHRDGQLPKETWAHWLHSGSLAFQDKGQRECCKQHHLCQQFHPRSCQCKIALPGRWWTPP